MTATKTFPCTVCGTDMGFDRPSGVCSSECLRKGQGFPPFRIHLSGAQCGDLVLWKGGPLGTILRWTGDGCAVLLAHDNRWSLSDTTPHFTTDSVVVTNDHWATGEFEWRPVGLRRGERPVGHPDTLTDEQLERARIDNAGKRAKPPEAK